MALDILVGIPTNPRSKRDIQWITPKGSRKRISSYRILMISMIICRLPDWASETAAMIVIKLLEGCNYDDTRSLPKYVTGMARKIDRKRRWRAARDASRHVSIHDIDPAESPQSEPPPEIIHQLKDELRAGDLDIPGLDDRFSIILELLAQENEETRAIIDLQYHGNLSHKAIAERLGISQKAIAKRISRFYAKVRAICEARMMLG